MDRPITPEEEMDTVQRAIAACHTKDMDHIADLLSVLWADRKHLGQACQLFTSGFAEGGYLPELGAPKTLLALDLMRRANVPPIYHRNLAAQIQESERPAK